MVVFVRLIYRMISIMRNLFLGRSPSLDKRKKPKLFVVRADCDAFDRQALRLFYTNQNSSEAQEYFRISKGSPRSPASLRRVV